MTEVIKLKVGKQNFDREKMIKFKKTGTIGMDVLKQCWGENPDVVFNSIIDIQFSMTFYLLCTQEVKHCTGFPEMPPNMIRDKTSPTQLYFVIQ